MYTTIAAGRLVDSSSPTHSLDQHAHRLKPGDDLPLRLDQGKLSRPHSKPFDAHFLCRCRIPCSPPPSRRRRFPRRRRPAPFARRASEDALRCASSATSRPHARPELGRSICNLPRQATTAHALSPASALGLEAALTHTSTGLSSLSCPSARDRLEPSQTRDDSPSPNETPTITPTRDHRIGTCVRRTLHHAESRRCQRGQRRCLYRNAPPARPLDARHHIRSWYEATLHLNAATAYSRSRRSRRRLPIHLK
jgi:hypothetical protein